MRLSELNDELRVFFLNTKFEIAPHFCDFEWLTELGFQDSTTLSEEKH
jgi:hypothetical protein